MLSLPGAWAQSLVRELRSVKPCGAASKFKKIVIIKEKGNGTLRLHPDLAGRMVT